MKYAACFLLAITLAASPVLASGGASQQGEARTANALFQWSTGQFPLKRNKRVQIGKTETIKCGVAEGCAISIELTISAEGDKNNTPLFAYSFVDNKTVNPSTQFAATCAAFSLCETTASGTLIVEKGSHKIQHFVSDEANLRIIGWHARTEAFH